MASMNDSRGRTIDYLRISVTDRCNLRCRYCMPEEGIALLSHEELLSFEEILTVCRCMAALGVSRVKLTGGEPLVRRQVSVLAGEIRRIPGISDVTMTSNGLLLPVYAKELKAAGVSSVNVSLDTLDPETFAQITRRDCFDDVQEGIRAARAAGLSVKINCAVSEDFDRTRFLAFAEFSRKEGIPVRFIEMMPIGQGRAYQAPDSARLLGWLREAYEDVTGETAPMGNGPAVYVRYGHGQGCIGLIGAVHHKFCDSCNRVRLTSDGFLKLCLAREDGVDLRTLLRTGASEETLAAVIRAAVMEKPKSHDFETGNTGKRTTGMSRIGG